MSTDVTRLIQEEWDQVMQSNREAPSDYFEGYLDALDYALYLMSQPEA